jgi:hypothetical protein
MAKVKDAPLTEEELAEIERAALDDQRLGIKGDYSFDVTGDALRLVAEVRRLRAELATVPPTRQCECGATRMTRAAEWLCTSCGRTVRAT